MLVFLISAIPAISLARCSSAVVAMVVRAAPLCASGERTSTAAWNGFPLFGERGKARAPPSRRTLDVTIRPGISDGPDAAAAQKGPDRPRCGPRGGTPLS